MEITLNKIFCIGVRLPGCLFKYPASSERTGGKGGVLYGQQRLRVSTNRTVPAPFAAWWSTREDDVVWPHVPTDRKRLINCIHKSIKLHIKNKNNKRK